MNFTNRLSGGPALTRELCLLLVLGVALLACQSGATQSVVVPPPGATEPVFGVGDTSLFYDDFEAYGTTADLTTGTNAKYWLLNGDVALVNTPGGDFAGGGKFVRFDYPDTTQRSNEIYTTQHHSPVLDTATVVIVTYGFRNTGAFWMTKSMIIRNNAGSQRFTLAGALYYLEPKPLQDCFYTSAYPYSPLDPSIPYRGEGPAWSRDGLNTIGGPDNQMTGPNTGYPAAQFLQAGTQVGPKNDGNWHRFTYRFTKEKAGGGTGRLEGWFDGVKFMEYVGDDASRCEHGKIWTWGNGVTVWDGDVYFVGTSSGQPHTTGPAVISMDGVRVWVP